ncbi:S8 family peptidase [Serratia marcescens]
MKAHIKLKLPQSLMDYRAITSAPPKKRSPVNRNAHFAKLRSGLDEAIIKHLKSVDLSEEIFGDGSAPQRMVLTFKDNPEVSDRLSLKSLDSNGMKLLSVNTVDSQVVANVAIPIDKIEKLKTILSEYATKETAKKRPKNQPLVESISEIDYGGVESLWFSTKPLPQNVDKLESYEVWLDTSTDTSDKVSAHLDLVCERLGVVVKQGEINFKERLVKIIVASVRQLNALQRITQFIAELRPANTVTTDFLELSTAENFQWADGLEYHFIERPVPICILDTGINSAHPLLKEFVKKEVVISAEPQWNASDIQGHGTGMAGLSLYGDLKTAIQNKKITINGILESVKILPDTGANDPKLYGNITSDAVYNVETIAPSERRVFTMAVSSPYYLKGAPSSWSAMIDSLASGSPDDPAKRLFILSAGNMRPQDLPEYPDKNILSSIEDPANSYNSLTIGYWASEDNITTEGYRLLAELTDLGPSSTTSISWGKNSPFKPDVIFEGGNHGFDDTLRFAADLEELSLMTTSHRVASGNYFSSFAETSAATAMASLFVSKLWAQYPNYWPETIRALVVHSATWPAKIMERNKSLRTKREIEVLLRMAGYGYPNLNKAISSGNKSVNLIIEDQIQPYKITGTFNKMVLYTLPWPSSELEKLGAEEVKLRVTLSYFIEPNPGERGWENKYKYSSFGLRFDFNSPGESADEFVTRINKKYRDENPDIDVGDGDSSKWLLGPTLRNRGSIHCDVWTGTAISLADKKHIAIFPVSGWWKDLKRENRQASMARFSLIVSIETKENNIELHNEISQILKVETEVENIVPIQ